VKAARVTAPMRFVVTGRYEWTGDQDIEVELTPDAFRWRFVGEPRFREATWNQIPATLDGMLDSQRMIGALFGRRRRSPQRPAPGPGAPRTDDQAPAP
jgi:hypothetical protein